MNSTAPQPLPDALRNWQVFDVEGQATPIDDPAPSSTQPPEPARIPDRQDDVIVLGIAVRHFVVAAGDAVDIVFTVLNNGGAVSLFRFQIEGWYDERWLTDNLPDKIIEPGERADLHLTLAPARESMSLAGDYRLAILARADAYPDRLARIGVVLTVQPFDALALDLPGSVSPALSWFKRSTVVPLTVRNRGNRSVAVQLAAAELGDVDRLAFSIDGAGQPQAALTLRPGQQATAAVRVAAERLPLVGLHSRLARIQFTARTANNPAVTAQARCGLTLHPLVGAWQLAGMSALALVGLAGVFLFLVAAVMLFALQPRSEAVPAPAAAVPPVIIVNLNQPIPAGTGDDLHGAGPAAAGSASRPDPSVPLVLPDQVSAPGLGGPVHSASSAELKPGGPPAAAAGQGLTYGELFRQVGRRYDLDWRMLAAMAYVESGFDAVALSSSGAMGLMQVLPGTWREWAAAANVTDPFDSSSNVEVAAIYLDHLRSLLAAKGYPGKQWMLVAYNWGPDKLNSFLAGGGSWDTLPAVRRQYAEDVLRTSQSIP